MEEKGEELELKVKLCVSGVCLALLAFASAGVTCYPVRSAAFKPISPRLCHALHIEQKRKKEEPSDNGAITTTSRRPFLLSLKIK